MKEQEVCLTFRKFYFHREGKTSIIPSTQITSWAGQTPVLTLCKVTPVMKDSKHFQVHRKLPFHTEVLDCILQSSLTKNMLVLPGELLFLCNSTIVSGGHYYSQDRKPRGFKLSCLTGCSSLPPHLSLHNNLRCFPFFSHCPKLKIESRHLVCSKGRAGEGSIRDLSQPW